MSRQTPASTNDQTNDNAIDKLIQNVKPVELFITNASQPMLALYYADHFVGFILKFTNTNPAQIISVLQSEDRSIVTAHITNQGVNVFYDPIFTRNMRSNFLELKEKLQAKLISSSEEHSKNWRELFDNPKFKTFLKNDSISRIERLSTNIEKCNLEIIISRAIEEQLEILSRIENQLNTNDEKLNFDATLIKLKNITEANIFKPVKKINPIIEFPELHKKYQQNLKKALDLNASLIDKGLQSNSNTKKSKSTTTKNMDATQMNQGTSLLEENKKLAKALELSEKNISELKTQISTLLSSQQQNDNVSQKNIDRLSTENNELKIKTKALEKENREIKAKLKEQNQRISELTSSNKDGFSSTAAKGTTSQYYVDTNDARYSIAQTPKEVHVGIINPQIFVLQNTVRQLNAQLYQSTYQITCLTNTLLQTKNNADQHRHEAGMLSNENRKLKYQKTALNEKLQKMRAILDKSMRHLLTDDRFAIVARDIDKTNNNYRPENGAGFFNRARKVVSNTEIKQLLDLYSATMRHQ